MSATRDARVVGLLLAAGRGRRFARAPRDDKLLALWRGEVVAVRAAETLARGVTRCYAVIRPDADALAALCERAGISVIRCDRAESGMGYSLACGVAHVAWDDATDAVLVALADMPAIRPSTIARLAGEAGNPDVVVAPSYQGRRGHPVLFGRAHFSQLMGLTGDAGARDMLRANPPRLVAIDDPGVLFDIDSPDDLAAGPPANDRNEGPG